MSKRKSGYIYHLSQIKGIHFHLYGANYENTQTENSSYMGKFAPEELVKHLDGQFGLVWDGDSCDTCKGRYGQYLRYNNPHKVSLYLVAGLPIIIWKQAALAKYIQEREVGICVESLFELEERLLDISEAEYAKMVENVNRIRNEIMQGRNLMRILQEQI